ncbi:AAA family ATPase [Clostridia bacterium]|nr:AAA family ATPase [Clostridia bacterium]
MILKRIEVNNYRKFLNTALSFDEDITLLAGANNSGKTSIIELMEHIINSTKTNLRVEDIPVENSKEWLDKVYPLFLNSFTQIHDNEKVIHDIVNSIFGLDSITETEPILLPLTNVKFTIDYDPQNDDIRNFADYIMDFDPTNHSFYFEYSFEPTASIFGKVLANDFGKLKLRFAQLTDPDSDILKINSIKERILKLYVSCLVDKCFFTDKQFSNRNEIETKSFKKLFNFHNICAGRSLDDQNGDKHKTLSKDMITLTSHNKEWKSLIEQLPDKILQRLEAENITSLVQETSINGLSDAISSIAQTNGGNTGNMVLNMDVSEDAIRTLIMQITSAKYLVDNHFLNESSQGLGYSNMIYILVQLENYKLSINSLLVNMFFIEEPESHMHPQMQNVFGKYLRKYYQMQKIQGLITTHSSEIVRATDMKNLRISRSFSNFKSDILDFYDFKDEIKNDPIIDNFYDWFFEVGFSEVVFADRVILYEGDTERMLIRKIATFDCFKKLNQLYVAFVQVGGAYAYNYKKLIEFLKVKTLIITDLDYDKLAKTENQIQNSFTTNATLKNFYKDTHNNVEPNVSDLYNWSYLGGNVILDGHAYLAYQGKDDGYSRTLEEAMLAKHYNVNAFTSKNRSSWVKLRSNDNLKYTIPQKNARYCIRDIVAHTSNGKTDFMYSVILNNYTEQLLPKYIEEGLLWLIQ